MVKWFYELVRKMRVYSINYTSLLWGKITENILKRDSWRGQQKVPAVIFSSGLRLHIVFTLPQNVSYHVRNTRSGTEFGIGNFWEGPWCFITDIFKDSFWNVPAVLVAPKPGVSVQTSGCHSAKPGAILSQHTVLLTQTRCFFFCINLKLCDKEKIATFS